MIFHMKKREVLNGEFRLCFWLFFCWYTKLGIRYGKPVFPICHSFISPLTFAIHSPFWPSVARWHDGTLTVNGRGGALVTGERGAAVGVHRRTKILQTSGLLPLSLPRKLFLSLVSSGYRLQVLCFQ
jgi:hypothetical protein